MGHRDMLEQLQGLVRVEERLLGRIGTMQQQANSLDTGPKDFSQRDLSQARATIRQQRVRKYIGKIQQRLAPISAEIDEQALNLFQNYSSQLRKKGMDLRVVIASGVSPFTEADFTRFAQEVEDFRQKPTREPLLARGMIVFNRPVSPPTEAASEPPAGKQQVKLTYADIEARGIHLAPLGKRLMELLLPHNFEQDAIPSSGWAAPVWRDASEAERKGRLKTNILRMRRGLPGTGLSIITVKAFRASEEVSYYLKVEEPKIVPAAPPVQKPDLKPAPPPEDDFLIQAISPIKRFRLNPTIKIYPHMLLSADTERFLDDFLRSKDAWSILNCMYRFRNRKRERYSSEEEVQVFYRHAIGYFTEWLAFSYLYPRYLVENLILLSPPSKVHCL